MFLASYLLNPAENHENIPEVAHEMNMKQVKYDEEIYGKGKSKRIPEKEIFSEHIIRKTKLLFELHDDMTEKLKQNEQYQLLKELEMPLAFILANMEYTGVQVDTNRLEKNGKRIETTVR